MAEKTTKETAERMIEETETIEETEVRGKKTGETIGGKETTGGAEITRKRIGDTIGETKDRILKREKKKTSRGKFRGNLQQKEEP